MREGSREEMMKGRERRKCDKLAALHYFDTSNCEVMKSYTDTPCALPTHVIILCRAACVFICLLYFILTNFISLMRASNMEKQDHTKMLSYTRERCKLWLTKIQIIFNVST